MKSHNKIDLNFDGKISKSEVKNNLHVPIVIRKNAVKGAKSFDDGSYSTIESLVNVSDLYLDTTYQRLPNEVKVSSIARNFDPDAFGIIICSAREDNVIAIIDGGHRVAALRLLGLENKTVNALVYFNLSIEDEARIFTLINQDRTKPKTSDIFKAQVAANDQQAIGLNSILSSLGLKAGNAPGNGIVRGIGTLKEIYKNAGHLNTQYSLTSLKNAFGEHSSSFNVDAVTALAIIFKKYGASIDGDRLVTALKKFGSIDGMINQAKIMNVRNTSPIKYTTLPFIIVENYNSKLRVNRIAPFNMSTQVNKIWK